MTGTTATKRRPAIFATNQAVWWLRLEGAAIGLVAVVIFASTGAHWWLFAFLILSPDISMIGYVLGPRLGAAIYNAGHNYVGPAALVTASLAGGPPALIAIAAIWVAHIGFDRALGYGLKHPEGFRETHLGRLR